MSSDPPKPPAGVTKQVPSLSRALDQSERVKEKVEQAGVDLSLVNATLKDEIAEGVPLANVEHALNQSEAIEINVQEAAAELVTVNEALAHEVEERQRLEQRLSKVDRALAESREESKRSNHSAMHDAVTGLPNLTLFNDRLRVAIAQAKRHAWRLAVMFIDLDDFKSINDTLGHDVGDKVLQMVGQRLKAMVRSGDTVSRRSGDEFLFLMLEAKDEANALFLATRIAETIGANCDIDGKSLAVKVSMGIALYPEDGITEQELLKNADAAMYVAKQKKEGPALYRDASAPNAH
jgi:diguanylate cyclase (GGDEF)-like protein